MRGVILGYLQCPAYRAYEGLGGLPNILTNNLHVKHNQVLMQLKLKLHIEEKFWSEILTQEFLV